MSTERWGSTKDDQKLNGQKHEIKYVYEINADGKQGRRHPLPLINCRQCGKIVGIEWGGDSNADGL
jgi:hypothetical protein